MTAANRYVDGHYLEAHPEWHVADSAWKAEQVLSMLAAHPEVGTGAIAEAGSGAGEILRVLRDRLPEARLSGYEISPQAHALASKRAGERLSFHLADLTTRDERFDLILVMDVLEHLEDPFAFVRALGGRAGHMILHIPLDVSAMTAIRPHPLTEARRTLGHIQFFVRETALAVLTDAGLTVVDHRYTWSGGPFGGSLKKRILYLARRGLHRIAPDLEVRLMGGHSLLVLAARRGWSPGPRSA